MIKDLEIEVKHTEVIKIDTFKILDRVIATLDDGDYLDVYDEVLGYLESEHNVIYSNQPDEVRENIRDISDDILNEMITVLTDYCDRNRPEAENKIN